MQPAAVPSSAPQTKTVSGITVAQVARSQPQQLLHISNVQMHQQQTNQILQMPSLVQTQQNTAQSGAVTVPTSMLSTSTMQMLVPTSTVAQTAITVSNQPQSTQSIGLTQFLQSTSQATSSHLTAISNTQAQNNKLQFVPQQLLIQSQQPNQQSNILQQQQQALILQKRTVPHQQQRILLQQQLVTQGGVTTAHWRPGSIVSIMRLHVKIVHFSRLIICLTFQQVSQAPQQQIQVGNQFTLASTPNVNQVTWQQQQQAQQQQPPQQQHLLLLQQQQIQQKQIQQQIVQQTTSGQPQQIQQQITIPQQAQQQTQQTHVQQQQVHIQQQQPAQQFIQQTISQQQQLGQNPSGPKIIQQQIPQQLLQVQQQQQSQQPNQQVQHVQIRSGERHGIIWTQQVGYFCIKLEILLREKVVRRK